jgi:4-hydroxybenzoate polyprenyltransferase
MDILWHFFTFVTIVMWGSLLAGSVTTINWLFAISVALDSCIGQVWNHYRDYLFDKKSRIKTFAVLVGTDITKKTLNILLGVHLIVLIPLIFFYSLSYFATIIILISGIVVGFFILQPQKHPFPSKQSIEAYIAIILSGSVYASCIIYHIFSVIGFSPLGLFHGIGIL